LKKREVAGAEARASNPMFGYPDPDKLTGACFPQETMRLGFAVKVIGKPGLKSNDSRRWRQKPHLKVSLSYLCEIFEYLRQHHIHMYRMSSDWRPIRPIPTCRSSIT